VTRWLSDFARRYRATGAWTEVTVSDLIEPGAERAASAVAMAGAGWRLSYHELADAAGRFGASLLELGLRPGDRVLLQLANAPETSVVYYGVIRGPASRTSSSSSSANACRCCRWSRRRC
jgi:2,3-dihydroxybenzoate-AMP ligase